MNRVKGRIMSRKKLLKLGISILALNALGVATYHVAPDLYEIKTVHAEEPGEDEEIPDAAERSIAFKFRDKMNDLEEDFNDLKRILQMKKLVNLYKMS